MLPCFLLDLRLSRGLVETIEEELNVGARDSFPPLFLIFSELLSSFHTEDFSESVFFLCCDIRDLKNYRDKEEQKLEYNFPDAI